MGKKYFASYGLDALTMRLKSIIDVENKDTLSTHLKQTIFFRDEGKVSGTINNENFKIWIHEQGRSGVTGIFYPIIKGTARSLQTGLEIELKSKFNLVGGTVYLILCGLLGYAILTGIVIQDNSELKFVIPRLMIGIILFGLMISLPSFIYLRTSKITKQYIIKELGLKNVR